MQATRIYYTILLYVKPGQHQAFLDYENNVLPLLPKYHGKLEIRLQINKTNQDQPDEIHVVSFPDAAAFEAYRQDPERQKYTHLFQSAVEKAILLEGISLSAK